MLTYLTLLSSRWFKIFVAFSSTFVTFTTCFHIHFPQLIGSTEVTRSLFGFAFLPLFYAETQESLRITPNTLRFYRFFAPPLLLTDPFCTTMWILQNARRIMILGNAAATSRTFLRSESKQGLGFMLRKFEQNLLKAVYQQKIWTVSV
jgi:hypothetical protein